MIKKTTNKGFALLLLLTLLVGSYQPALAHGLPVIVVNPEIVAAGGEITVTGSEMEVGEVFSITLEGMAGSTKLGEATAVSTGEEGGFTISFTIPLEISPGSYIVKASPTDGDEATVDLTITASTDKASSQGATMQEASGAPHPLDRSKPPVELAVIGVVILASLLSGFWLIRPRG